MNILGDSQEFGGIRTFLHAPYINSIEETDADVVIVGVPFDAGTSARPGARYGPRQNISRHNFRHRRTLRCRLLGIKIRARPRR